jgi:hypothetical protein
MATQHVPVTGGCHCGAIRYEARQAPIKGFYCHCTNCQKIYGGLFMACVRLVGSGFRFIKGEPKYYRSSKFARRGFCDSCGSPLIFLYEGNPDCYVLLGSLDHPEDWPFTKDAQWGPTVHWFTEKKVAWQEISDGLPELTAADAVGAHAAEDFVRKRNSP